MDSRYCDPFFLNNHRDSDPLFEKLKSKLMSQEEINIILKSIKSFEERRVNAGDEPDLNAGDEPDLNAGDEPDPNARDEPFIFFAKHSVSSIRDKIRRLNLAMVKSLIAEVPFLYNIPSRNPKNQEFNKTLKHVVLKNKTFSSSVRKTILITKVLQLVYKLSYSEYVITKREVYYQYRELFEDQNESDNVLDDVACILGCFRSDLRVIAAPRGMVVGNLTYNYVGVNIDCRQGVHQVCREPDQVVNLETEANFVLVIEKSCTFDRLMKARFYEKYNCIIVTSMGHGDVATRQFVKKLNMKGLPVLALMDFDPEGIKILSKYKYGSERMCYNSSDLIISNIMWLGVKSSDCERFKIPVTKLSKKDAKLIVHLLKNEFVKENAEWVHELQVMEKNFKKADMVAMNLNGFDFITDYYLPLKLQELPFHFPDREWKNFEFPGSLSMQHYWRG